VDFSLFVYCTMGRRSELEAGRAGLRPDLYQRMLDELAAYATLADDAGYAGFGHPEHHLQVEGFEASNDPRLMAMWLGMHTKRLKVITCGFVSTTHNPLRTAEDIATIDHMLKGRFGVGLVRGYQARWVENFKIRPDLAAVGEWNKDSDVDRYNRDYFAEFVEIVVLALTQPTFSYEGQFWTFPPKGMVNPHPMPTYHRYGAGVDEDMTIRTVSVVPRPYQDPHPRLYGGFTGSLRTAMFWARYKGKPIVLASDLDFCNLLWTRYREETQRFGHDVTPGDEAAWGGIMICAPTDAEAHAQLDDMRWLWGNWSEQFRQPLPELLVGSPDTISRRLDEAKARIDPQEVFLLVPQGIAPPVQVNASLELFATKVLPRFS
jgi:alkanesulfonate monooxygenase SsuD/methylene tetrahydromethanopterin reductase-like flavin-dependent oxidoreductase (luciferase family)